MQEDGPGCEESEWAGEQGGSVWAAERDPADLYMAQPNMSASCQGDCM
jgi:hypothetical protein